VGWVLHVSFSKFVTNLSQESVCLVILLTYLLASAVFLLYSSLSSSFFEFSHFVFFSLFLLIVLFGHPIFLNTFSYFVSLFFLNFDLLLILTSFVNFSIPSQYCNA